MKIAEVKGYTVRVQLHNESCYRECVINVEEDTSPAEIQALAYYVAALAMNKKRVKAIKYAREELHCGLRDAKDFVADAQYTAEQLQRDLTTPNPTQPSFADASVYGPAFNLNPDPF